MKVCRIAKIILFLRRIIIRANIRSGRVEI